MFFDILYAHVMVCLVVQVALRSVQYLLRNDGVDAIVTTLPTRDREEVRYLNHLYN